MKLKNIKFLILSALAIMIFSCQKDAIIDGGVSDPKVNMTTYDYLKAHPKGLFDTLLLIVDKAQMKEAINSNGTFIVPTDYSVNSYISLRQSQIRKIDERKDYTLDSLFKEFTPKMLKDSLSVYFFAQNIVREELDENGREYQSSTSPYKFLVTLEEHGNDDYNAGGIISNRPKFMWFNRIIGEKDVIEGGVLKDPSNDADKLDSRNILQTSGIITNTGTVHVINNGHTWIRSLKLNLN